MGDRVRLASHRLKLSRENEMMQHQFTMPRCLGARRGLIALAATVAACVAPLAQAQGYPSKPIKLQVPFASQ